MLEFEIQRMRRDYHKEQNYMKEHPPQPLTLKDHVSVLVREEYARAAKKFGKKNNSPHESYAVIKEEVEEAVEQMGSVEAQLGLYWSGVKANENMFDTHYLKAIREAAICGACELIQVAAMAEKAMKGYDKGPDDGEVWKI